MDLNLLDHKILQELDLDARIPTTVLARRLKQSREKINYRIDNLEKKGIIRKYVTMINPSKLGYSIYKLFFQFQNLSKEKEKELYSWLTKNNYIYWVASAKGSWDCNLTVFANDIIHFDEILNEFIALYGKYIAKQEFNTTLHAGILSKDWLGTKNSKLTLVGGCVTDDDDLDDIDVELLQVLANNARMKIVDIAKKINVTSKIAMYRIKQLEKKEIILGYTISIDLEKLGMQFFKANIYFSTLNKQTKSKLIEYCKQNKNIGFFVLCVGSWPFEMELIVKDNKEFYQIMDDFREQFPEMKGYDTLIFPKEYKFDWMPLCYEVKN